jgi:DNA-binding response OmpR family regulator
MKKVLVVDDSPDVVKLVATRLKLNNYQVISAYSGREGLEKARQEKPDLILLDILMPDMDGNVISAALRADLHTKDIPIIYFTCLLKKGEERELELNIGSNQRFFLAKPFNSEELLDKVKNVLENQ